MDISKSLSREALEKLCDRLSETRLSITPQIRSEAMRILEEYRQKSFKHTPTGAAAGALYAASLLQGEFITQEEIAKVAVLKSVTVMRAFRSINEALKLGIEDPALYRLRKMRKLRD